MVHASGGHQHTVDVADSIADDCSGIGGGGGADHNRALALIGDSRGNVRRWCSVARTRVCMVIGPM